MVTVHLTLDSEFVEDLSLIAPRPHLKRRDVDGQVGWSTTLNGKPFLEASAIGEISRVVCLEGGVFPILLERGSKRVEEMALLDRRQTDIPLEPVDERALGEIR